jgi:hypothetical protein
MTFKFCSELLCSATDAVFPKVFKISQYSCWKIENLLSPVLSIPFDFLTGASDISHFWTPLLTFSFQIPTNKLGKDPDQTLVCRQMFLDRFGSVRGCKDKRLLRFAAQ